MTQSTGGGEKSESTRLENSTYNILRAAGIDADFLYDTVDTYINDAQKSNRNDLVDVWSFKLCVRPNWSTCFFILVYHL
jgi:hypothetical protein